MIDEVVMCKKPVSLETLFGNCLILDSPSDDINNCWMIPTVD